MAGQPAGDLTVSEGGAQRFPAPQDAAQPIPFHVPSIDEDDVAAVVDVLRSRWITTGARCAEFESAFAEALGGDVTAIAVTSGTAALHLALEAAGVGPGDLVLTTPYTFTATAEVVRYLGAHIVFADVDERTGNLTAASVLEAYGRLSPVERRSVRALVPVHFAGLPCDMRSLVELAAERGWALIDDAAHAFPAHHDGRPVGTFGDATAFSFYATKTLCTGEGGMVVTRRPDLARRMRTMRLHGIDRDVFARYRTGGSWYYEVVAPGFKYNLTDLAAAMGLSQLPRRERQLEQRARIANTYTRAFSAVDGLSAPPDARPGDRHAWHLYTLRVQDGRAVRDLAIEELGRRGIGTSVHFIPLHLQPYYRDAYGLRPEDFPCALRLFESEISLPLYPDLSRQQVERVVQAVPEALIEARRRASRAA